MSAPMDASTSSGSSAAPATKRLMIKKMVLENFKSYAGAQEIGPFHKSFSSVVGPNGSGKSNVIDAMLFVFGFRAMKLRQRKVSELIHNSDQFQNLDYCRVSVHFQEIIDLPGDDDFEVVPDSELVVSRTGHRNNSSSYHLDEKPASANQVTQLLRTKGIDLDHNRFLILQGEVEQIAMMKPKAQTEHDEGLLEYLEDIIGSDRFKEPIAEATKVADELNESRTEKLNRVKAVEKDRESLEGAKNDAVAFLQLENDLAKSKSALCQIQLAELSKTSTGLTEKKTLLEAKLQQEKEAMKENLAALSDMEKRIQQESKEHAELCAASEKAKLDFAAFERKDIKFREDLKHCRSKEKKLEKALEKEAHTVSENESWAANYTADKTKAERELEELQSARKDEEEKLDKMYESLKGEIAAPQAELEAKQKELLPLRKVVDEVESKVNLAKSELGLFAKKSEIAKSQLAEAKQSALQVRASISERQESIQKLKKRQSECQKQIGDITAGITDAQNQEAGLQQQVSAARAKVEEGKAALQATRNRGKVLEGLLDLKRKGKIPGIYGRLGDLGTIDAKYDVAVTTACPALNNIVVEDTDCAQACVEALRKGNLGRATFVILSEISRLADTIAALSSTPTPDNAPRLFDLVRPHDKKVATAFYHALRDTLVAKDLDQASRIAFGGSKRWRVVTLEGQLIDTSGTMSGGGNSVSRGGMITSTSASASAGGKMYDANGTGSMADLTPKQIEAFEADLDLKLQALKKNREEVKRLEHARDALAAEVKKNEFEMDKFAMDIKAFGKQIEDLDKQIGELEAKQTPSADDVARQAQLSKELVAHERELAKARASTLSIEQEIERLQAKILDAGGIRLKAQRSKVATIVEQLENAGKAVTKASVAVKTAAKTAEKAKEKMESVRKEIEETQEYIKKIQDEFKEIEAGALKVMQAHKEATALLETKDALLTELKEKFESVKKISDKARAEEVDLCNQLETVSRTLREQQAKEKSLTGELAGLALHNIDAHGSLEPVAGEPQQEAPDNDENDNGNSKPDESNEEDEGEEASGDADAMRVDKKSSAAAKKKGRAALVKKPPQPKSKEASALKSGLTLPVPMLTLEQLSKLSKESLRAEILHGQERLSKLSPNLSAIQEYRKKEAEYLSRVQELDAITEKRDAARAQLDELRKKRLDEFMAGFSVITMKLKEMYQMITLGGDAELELVDSLDPFSEGIIFSVRPPKKSWKNISNLSGGEKTLSSLALVFALHHYKPTPLYVMDEIDAALDFKNVSIVANYIKERTKNAQFIIISLRNNMFELADRLVGIYKTDNCTKSVTINPVMVTAASMHPGADAGSKAAVAAQ